MISLIDRIKMATKKYPLGLIPSEEDPRDYTVISSTEIENVWPDFDRIPDDMPSYHQTKGTCGLQSTRRGWHRYYGFEFGTNFPYGLARPTNMTRTPGVSLKTLADFISKYGIAPYKDDPNELEVPGVVEYALKNKDRLMAAAAPYAGWTYARLTTIDQIKAAIRDRRHITFRMQVSTFTTDKYGWFRGDGIRSKGSHAMVILGYGKWQYSSSKTLRSGVEVLQSWGPDWGIKGRCYMEWSHVLKCKEVYVWFPPKEKDPIEKPAIKPQRSLSRGAQGEDVKTLQLKLIQLKYNVGEDGATGHFDGDTYNAVRKFQRDHKLKVDGIVGIETWGVIFSL